MALFDVFVVPGDYERPEQLVNTARTASAPLISTTNPLNTGIDENEVIVS